MLTIMIRFVFQEGAKLYLQIYLDECLYESVKMLEYDRIDVSEGIDINKTSKSKNVKCVIIGTLKRLVLNLNHFFAMVVMV